MKLSKKGIDLIKELEGLKLQSYKCTAGIWTIGLGNTFYEDGRKVQANEKISESRAYDLFSLISPTFENAINKNVKSKITQNQFDALFCFAYNVGVRAFTDSTLLKLVNINPNDGNIAKQFLRWNKIKGVESKGLTNRRIKESSLYFTTYS